MVVHGDDFKGLGMAPDLDGMKAKLEAGYPAKHRGRIGGEIGDQRSARLADSSRLPPPPRSE